MRADPWAIALPLSRVAPALSAGLIEHDAFPREALLESIVRLVEESLATDDRSTWARARGTLGGERPGRTGRRGEGTR